MLEARTKSLFVPYDTTSSAGHSVAGELLVLPGLHSPQLNNLRNLLVHLPPSYHSAQQRYPVVYMQDGQNLFDRATGFAGQEWQVDETMQALSAEGLEAIVVGLPHMGEQRNVEYNPFGGRPAGRGEAYLSFLADTVKPLIDGQLRTRPEREANALIGSSMGGLISLFGFFNRPETFGLVASMSPALWYARQAIYPYVQRADYVAGRVYLDHGSRENKAHRMRRLLLDKGYIEGHDLLYVEEPGGEHNEAAWARRFPNALRFLLREFA